MMSSSPYGGESIAFPASGDLREGYPPTSSAIHQGFGLGGDPKYMRGETSANNCSGKDIGADRTPLLRNRVPAGHVFVLTVVYRHEFSSSLVKTLFAGGSNTNHEDIYMLWSRGSGIVDKRDE